jgi:hypothetical protein
MALILPPAAKKLGEVTLGAGATTIGPIVFGAGWGMLFVEIYIAGYSASQIAQIRLGTGTTVDTAANYSSFSNSFTTAAVAGTSNVSATGLRLSNVAQTNARRCIAQISNSAARPKIYSSQTVDYSAQAPTAASAMANGAQVNGAWFNNAQAQCIGIDSGGAGTLNTGSSLMVYGIAGV